MALYAIGDLQGCNAELGALLAAIRFSADRDRLWFVGDLVNRGPDSLGVLRRIRSLGDAATITLGNHDLHLLAVAFGSASPRDDDTLDEVLAAPERDALLEWLAGLPLFHEDPALNVCMLHAGLAPQSLSRWQNAERRSPSIISTIPLAPRGSVPRLAPPGAWRSLLAPTCGMRGPSLDWWTT